MHRPLGVSLGAALLLHVGLAALLAIMPPRPLGTVQLASVEEPESLLWVEAIEPSQAAIAAPPSAGAPADTEQLALAGVRPGSNPTPEETLKPTQVAPEPQVDDVATTADPSSELAAAPPGSGAESPATAEGPAGLSLGELGIGVENNPFLVPGAGTGESPVAAAARSRRQVLEHRLDQSLREGLAAHDQKLGLGPEGPAISAVKEIVLDSASMPNTSGLLSVRTDASGLVVEVEVLSAENQSMAWSAIARDLKQALANKKLRVPRGSAGVRLQIAVESRVTLPSGADPGLAVELFGVNLGEGTERSARIKILSPEVVVEEVDIPYTNGKKMKVVGFVPHLFSLMGDPTDIGAVARRIVHARLVALETLAPPVPALPALPQPHVAP
jgi:hypothetical protein